MFIKAKASKNKSNVTSFILFVFKRIIDEDISKVNVKKYNFTNSKFSLSPTKKSIGVTKIVINKVFLTILSIVTKYIILVVRTKVIGGYGNKSI